MVVRRCPLVASGLKPIPPAWDTEVIVSRHLGAPDFWHDKALPYLKRDAWEALLWPVILFLILGGLLLLIGRRRRRRSGFH